MSRGSRRTVADLVLLAKVAAASAVGGLAAVGVLWWTEKLVSPKAVSVAVLVLVLFCAMLVDTFRPLPSAPRRAGPMGHPPGYPAGAYASHRPDGPPPYPVPVPPEPVHTWYAEAARDAATVGAAPAVAGPSVHVRPEPEGNGVPHHVEEIRVPGRDSSAVRRVVQCPRCADFALDLRNEHGTFTFACRACRHVWRWVPGTPWPATVARPAAGTRRTGSVGPS